MPDQETELPIVRLAERLRISIVLVSFAVLVLASAHLFAGVVDDLTITYAAAAVGAAAAIYFLRIVFDKRFQRAISAVNAARRAEARQWGGPARPRFGLPVGDRVLAGVGAVLLVMFLIAGNQYRRMPVTALLFAAFGLCVSAQTGLMVRGAPTDEFHPPFT